MPAGKPAHPERRGFQGEVSCAHLRADLEVGAPNGRSVLFEEVVDAFFVVAVEVAGEGGFVGYELALAER